MLTDAQCDQFEREGVVLLPDLLPPEFLQLLQSGADTARERVDRLMDACGVDQLDINLRGQRYFSVNPSQDRPALYRFICSDLMADIARQLLGDTVFVFWEQYVIKGPDVDRRSRFRWHQDSAYVPYPHRRYLTCWCALDQMDATNGTVRVLPFSRGPAEAVPHRRDPQTDELIGYDGPDPGDPIHCPAGSVAFFTSHTLHASDCNHSDRYRRVYLIQYATEVVRSPAGDDAPYGRSEVLWLDGRRMLRVD